MTLLVKDYGLDTEVLKAIFLTMLELIVFASVVLCVSIRSSTLFTGIFGLFIFVAGNLVSNLTHLTVMSESVAVKMVFRIMQIVLPNFEKFNLRDQIVLGAKVPAIYLVQTTLYALGYFSVMMILAYLLIRNREV